MNNKMIIAVGLLVLLSVITGAYLTHFDKADAADAPNPDGAKTAPDNDVAQLREQIKKLEGLVPDQAAVMTHVGYHFTNLWFAVEQENWPLADFYLGEARSNLKWAVRTKPIRKGPKGEQIDLAAIAQAIDNSQFTDLKKAIDGKQKERFAQLYDDTLTMCYGCHKASGKPYLRPQRPAAPEVRIINMDPNATKPE